MKTFLLVVVTLLLSLLTILYGVWAFEHLWDWFATDAWPTKPTTQTLYGVSLLLSLARSGRVMTPEEFQEEGDETLSRALASAVAGLIAITLVLAFGLVLK